MSRRILCALAYYNKALLVCSNSLHFPPEYLLLHRVEKTGRAKETMENPTWINSIPIRLLNIGGDEVGLSWTAATTQFAKKPKDILPLCSHRCRKLLYFSLSELSGIALQHV